MVVLWKILMIFSFHYSKAPRRNWSQETSLEEQRVELRRAEAAVSAEGRGPRSAAALQPEIYLSQAFCISLNPLRAFRLTLIFDVSFTLLLVVK